ncbi:MAG: hypothetical protein ABI183_05200 [Polyangiaceae bacterium]
MRALLAVCVVVALVGGCSSSSSAPDSTNDCISVCQNETTHSCTNITDCTIFCDAIEGVATSGSCVTQINAYVSCAKAATVCAVKNSCSSQGGDFSSCAAQYCDAHTTDTNCTQTSNLL